MTLLSTQNPERVVLRTGNAPAVEPPPPSPVNPNHRPVMTGQNIEVGALGFLAFETLGGWKDVDDTRSRDVYNSAFAYPVAQDEPTNTKLSGVIAGRGIVFDGFMAQHRGTKPTFLWSGLGHGRFEDSPLRGKIYAIDENGVIFDTGYTIPSGIIIPTPTGGKYSSESDRFPVYESIDGGILYARHYDFDETIGDAQWMAVKFNVAEINAKIASKGLLKAVLLDRAGDNGDLNVLAVDVLGATDASSLRNTSGRSLTRLFVKTGATGRHLLCGSFGGADSAFFESNGTRSVYVEKVWLDGERIIDDALQKIKDFIGTDAINASPFAINISNLGFLEVEDEDNIRFGVYSRVAKLAGRTYMDMAIFGGDGEVKSVRRMNLPDGVFFTYDGTRIARAPIPVPAAGKQAFIDGIPDSPDSDTHNATDLPNRPPLIPQSYGGNPGENVLAMIVSQSMERSVTSLNGVFNEVREVLVEVEISGVSSEFALNENWYFTLRRFHYQMIEMTREENVIVGTFNVTALD